MSGIWWVTLYAHTLLPEHSRTFPGYAVISDTESPSVSVAAGWRVGKVKRHRKGGVGVEVPWDWQQ